jgi:hypothetical protein
MGLFKAVGSFGSRVWGTVKRAIEPIRAAFNVAREIGAEVTTGALLGEYRKVVKLEGIAEQIATLEPDQYITPQLYQEADIPWDKPFAYEVTMSGRDLATGRFARTDRVLTFSRQLTIQEIEEEALARFGSEGAYPQIDITHISVTAAQYREGEQYRLW